MTHPPVRPTPPIAHNSSTRTHAFDPASPHPSQIVLSIICCYATLIGGFKIKSMMSAKTPVPAVPVAAPTPSAAAGKELRWGFEPPTMENFDVWGENADNWKKWEAFMDGKVEEWANELK